MRYALGRFLIRQQQYNPLHDEAKTYRGFSTSPWGLTKVLTAGGVVAILVGFFLPKYEVLLAGGSLLAAGVLLALIQAIAEEARVR